MELEIGTSELAKSIYRSLIVGSRGVFRRAEISEMGSGRSNPYRRSPSISNRIDALKSRLATASSGSIRGIHLASAVAKIGASIVQRVAVSMVNIFANSGIHQNAVHQKYLPPLIACNIGCGDEAPPVWSLQREPVSLTDKIGIFGVNRGEQSTRERHIANARPDSSDKFSNAIAVIVMLRHRCSLLGTLHLTGPARPAVTMPPFYQPIALAGV